MDEKTIQRELRRNRSTLSVVGMGVIAFGVWSAVKIILMMALRTEDLLAGVGIAELAAQNAASRDVGIAVLCVFLALDVLLRLFIGLRARSEGLGRRTGRAYIVLACLLAAGAVFSDVGALRRSLVGARTGMEAILSFASHLSVASAGGLDDAIVVIVVELTSAVTLIELIVAALRVKRLEHLAAAREA